MEIIEKIEEAKAVFSEWGWTMDFKGEDGEVFYASSRDEAEALTDPVARKAAINFADEVDEAVKRCRHYADAAILAIKNGERIAAIELLAAAAATEREFGDATAYGCLAELLAEMIGGEK
jgi:histidine ammonia-lyase